MSDSIQHVMHLVPEVTFGVAPTTPSMTRVRNTSCSLGLTKEGKESEEADPSRMVTDYRHGNRQVGGEIGFEFSYGSFDLLLLGALCAASWVQKMNVSSSAVSVASGDSSFNGTGFPQLHVGDVFTAAGFASANNNGQFKVVSATSTKIVVTKVDGTAAGLVTAAAGTAITLVSAAEVIKAGNARKSFSMLRNFSDQGAGDKPFHLFSGVMVNTWTLAVTPGANVTGTFGLLGKGLTLSDNAPTGATLGAPTSSRVFDSFTGSLMEGGTVNAYVTEVQLKVENGLEAQFVLFNKETLEPSMGKFRLTGTLGVHFRNAAMLEKFLNETSSSLVFSLTDLDGNTYTFRVPRLTLNGGQPDTSAQGTILLSMPFMAINDVTSGTAFSVERIQAAS
jgi:hypothetical protein